MTAFEAALDMVYADDSIARDAVYAPPGEGAAVPCRVIGRLAEQVEGALETARIVRNRRLVEVRASEVAHPVEGGRFTIDGQAHTILGAPRREDVDRLVWICEVRG